VVDDTFPQNPVSFTHVDVGAQFEVLGFTDG